MIGSTIFTTFIWHIILALIAGDRVPNLRSLFTAIMLLLVIDMPLLIYILFPPARMKKGKGLDGSSDSSDNSYLPFDDTGFSDSDSSGD